MENQKSFFHRVNDPTNKLNKKDFFIAYFGYWGIFVVIGFILAMIFSGSVAKAGFIGLNFGFFMIFQQRLQYFGMNKWIAAVTFTGIGNVALFIYLALKSDNN